MTEEQETADASAGRHESTQPAREAGRRHEAPEPVPGFRAELRDAIAPRTVALVIGVLLLQLGFVLSYVGAFHRPTPRDVAVQVVAPGATAGQTVAGLNGIAGSPLSASPGTSEAAATTALRSGDTSGVLVVDPNGTQDRLLVASAGGTGLADAVQAVVGRAEQAQGRTVAVSDVVPLQTGDGRGLTGFYLVVGWLVGGYLMASIIGVAKGARPLNRRRAVIRLGSVVPYAVVSGVGGAVIVGPVLGALDGAFWPLAGIGALLVAAAAAVTMAFQSLVGVIGIGLTVLVFVVLGNPSAGGAYQWPLLPPFWRAIGPVLPNGAGVDAVRRAVYFGSHAVTGPLLVTSAWLVGGVLVTLLAILVRERRDVALPA